jgi:hypothetical protein
MSPSRNLTPISAAAEAGGSGPLGLFGSVLLHGAIIAAALLTWAHRLDIASQSSSVVPVDLVTLADKTDVAPMVQKAPQIQPKDFQSPALEQPAAPTIPTQKAEPAPDVLPQKLVPQPVAKPVPKNDKFDINNISALLDKRAPQSVAVPNAKTGARTIQGIGAQNAATADLADLLRSQIAQCWSPPVGAPHPDQLIVSFELFLNPDGSVAQPPQLTANSGSGDPFMRAAAEAARRAIYACAPYKLPAGRYGQWRDITFVFDPRQMVGQ